MASCGPEVHMKVKNKVSDFLRLGLEMVQNHAKYLCKKIGKHRELYKISIVSRKNIEFSNWREILKLFTFYLCLFNFAEKYHI